MRAITVLGIETSCDETAVAVVRGVAPGPGAILSNVILSQIEAHRPFGGVVPEIAARAHVEVLDDLIVRALGEAGLALDDMDAVAATAGPGLIGGVMVGLVTGKALALAASKPLIAVNHLEAHALAARLALGTPFPFLLLLVSGGHCQLVAAEGVGRYQLLGSTIDDAAGEAFDKVAKMLGLPYPGGPRIESLAAQGRAARFAFPRPMRGRPELDFSFSGLKTAVRQAVDGLRPLSGADAADVAASFQAAVVASLEDRVRRGLKHYRTMIDKSNDMRLVVSGGVAANQAIRRALHRVCEEEGGVMAVPPPDLCTDNAAMVAWAGVERWGFTPGGHRLDVPPLARWPLENVT